MPQADFGQQSLEALPGFRRVSTLPLVVVHHEHPVLGPAPGHRAPRQVILQGSRLAMLQHLLRARFTDVHHRQTFLMLGLQLPVAAPGNRLTVGGTTTHFYSWNRGDGSGQEFRGAHAAPPFVPAIPGSE
jgi:hypothetical protein